MRLICATYLSHILSSLPFFLAALAQSDESEDEHFSEPMLFKAMRDTWYAGMPAQLQQGSYLLVLLLLNPKL